MQRKWRRAWERTAMAAMFVAAATGQGQAMPQGGQVSSGTGAISQTGNTMTVNQATDKLSVNWQSFNIAHNEHVNFTQPSASAVALNRVVGNDSSSIYGQLTANGKVFLINPNGILFAPGSQVNVGGIVASTLNMSDKDFTTGNYHFVQQGTSSGTVINQGNITAADKGYVAMLAPEVRNEGVIVAKQGTVALGAGSQATLDFSGDGRLSLAVNETALNAAVSNKGAIQADGGLVVMSARAAGDLVNSVVNNTGVVQAKSVHNDNGTIVLDGGTAGVVTNSGTLDASGKNSGETGGTVKVLGDKVALTSGAQVDVSGDAGGGTALIGGNFHGTGTEQNATAAYIDKNTSIKADAITKGDGGKVAVWSNEATRFYGDISAKGGSQGGSGGEVETSGKYLDAQGTVDASAAKGKAGEWLLDPYNITIQDTGSETSVGTSPNFTSSADSAILLTSSIETALNGGTSVTVTTGSGGSQNGDITISSSIDKTSGGDAALTLQAVGSIYINSGGITASGTNTGKLDIILDADSGGSGVGGIDIFGSTISSHGGNIIMGGGSSTGKAQDIGYARQYALWDPFHNGDDGAISVKDTTVDATGAGVGGNILLRGKNTSIDYNFPIGLDIIGTTLKTSGNGSITLEGIGAGIPKDSNYPSFGINLIPGDNSRQTAIISESGSITLTGTLDTASNSSYDGIRTQGTVNIYSSGGKAISLSAGNAWFKDDGNAYIGCYYNTSDGTVTKYGSPITISAGGLNVGTTYIETMNTVNITETVSADTATLGNIQAGTLIINGLGAVTQNIGTVLTASGLDLLGNSANYTLTNTGNSITTLAGNTGSVNFVNSGSFTVDAVNTTTGLTASGDITIQSGTINLSKTVSSSGGGVNLTGNSLYLSCGNNDNTNITAHGDVTVNAPVYFSGGYGHWPDDIITSTGGSGTITFNGQVNFVDQSSLKVDAGGGNIVFNKPVTGSSGDFVLYVDRAASLTFNDNVDLHGNVWFHTDALSLAAGKYIRRGHTDGADSGGNYFHIEPYTHDNSVWYLSGDVLSRLSGWGSLYIGNNSNPREIQIQGPVMFHDGNIYFVTGGSGSIAFADTLTVVGGGLGFSNPSAGSYTVSLPALTETQGGISTESNANLVLGADATLTSAYSGAPGAAITLNGNVSGAGKSLTLAAGTGSVTLAGTTGGAGTAALGDITIAAGSIALNGPVTASGYVSLTSSGLVSQAAPITAAGLELLGTNGVYTLTNIGNSITTLAGSTGTIDFVNSGSFTVGAVNATTGLKASGDVSLTASGDAGTLTVASPITKTDGSGTTSLNLTAGNSVLINANAAITDAVDGDWNVTVNGSNYIKDSANLNTSGSVALTAPIIDIGTSSILAANGFTANGATYIVSPSLDITAASIAFNGTLDTGNDYVLAPGTADWSTAFTNAQNYNTGDNRKAHLVTITSENEQKRVQVLAPGMESWLGFSDAASEGTWLYAAGSNDPQNGVQFWSGKSDGSAKNGAYTNWAAGEPNDSDQNEDYAEMLANGKWNDKSGGESFHYVIEVENPAAALNLHAGTGAVTFGGMVGGSKNLGALTVNAATVNIGGSVLTAGAQDYNAAVKTAADSIIFNSTGGGIGTNPGNTTGSGVAAHPITFGIGSTLDSYASGTAVQFYTGGGTVTFDGTVGGTTPLASLSFINSPVQLNTAAVTVSGNLTTDSASPITLGTGFSPLLSAENITIAGNISKTDTMAGSLNLTAQGTIILDGGTNGLNITSSSTPLNVTMTAGDDIIVKGASSAPVDITTDGGAVSLYSNHDDNGGGIYITYGNIATGGGNITIGGGSNLSGNALRNNTNSIFREGGLSHGGISLSYSNIDAGSGNIIMRGSNTVDSTDWAIGVDIIDGTVIKTSGLGTVELSGSGGSNSTGFSSGVNLYNGGVITTGTGTITLTGTAAGSGGKDYGVTLDAGGSAANQIYSTGGGAIAIETTGSKAIETIGNANPSRIGYAVNNGSEALYNSNISLISDGAVDLTGAAVKTNGTVSITATTGAIMLGNITAGPTLTLNAPGTVGQVSGTALTAAGLELQGANGVYILTNTGNNITTLAGDTGSVKFADSHSFYVGKVNNTAGLTFIGDATLQALNSGDIVVTNPIVKAGAPESESALLLQSGDNIIIFKKDDSNIGSITASGGKLNITLDADTDGNGVGGIDIVSTNIASNGGNIFMGGGAIDTGNGKVTGIGNAHYYTIDNYNKQDSLTTYTKVDPLGTGDDGAVTVKESTVDAGGGNIILHGENIQTTKAGSNLIYSIGLDIISNGIKTTGNGTIYMEGTGSGADSNSYGINIINDIANASYITTENGSITVQGNTNAGTKASGGGIKFGDGNSLVSNIYSTGGGAISLLTDGSTLTGFSSATVNIGYNDSVYSSPITISAGTVDLSKATVKTTGEVDIASASGTISLGNITAGTVLKISAADGVTQAPGTALMITGTSAGDGLELLGTNGVYTLTSTGNSVTTLAGNTGSVNFVNSGSFTVGAVNTTTGLTSSGDATLTAQGTTGDITVSQSINMNGNSTNALALTLKANEHIIFDSGAGVTVRNGKVNVMLNSDADGNAAGGIYLGSGTNISSNGGNILLGGGSNALGNASGTGILRSNSGGNDDAFSNKTMGIGLNGASLQSSGGTITLRGQGSANTNYYGIGVTLYNNSSIAAGSGGTIVIDGISSGPGSYNGHSCYGILLEDAVVSAAGSGSIMLKGTGSAANSGSGMEIKESSITAIDDAIISLTGEAGEAQNYACGMEIIDRSTISAVNGNIQINGTGATYELSSAADNTDPSDNKGRGGINIYSGSQVEVSGTGGITLTGTAGTGGSAAVWGINLEGGAVMAAGPNVVVAITGTGANGGKAVDEGSGTVQAANLAVVSSGGDISLTNVNEIGTIAVSSNNNAVSINNGSKPLSIGTVNGVNGVDSGTANTTFTDMGTVTQTAAITAGGLGLTGAGGTFDLEQPNHIGTLAANTGSITLKNSGAINIGSVTANGVTTDGVTTTGTFSLTAGGDITQTKAISTTGAATFNAGSGNINLNDDNNDFKDTVELTGGNVTVHDANDIRLGTSNVSGDLTVTAVAGAISQSGAIDAHSGTTTLTAGTMSSPQKITLNDANNDFGTVVIPNSSNTTLNDKNGIALGNLNVTNLLDLTAGGNVSQISGQTISAGNLAVSANGSVNLNEANTIGTAAITASGHDITLRDDGGFAIGEVTRTDNSKLSGINAGSGNVQLITGSTGTVTE
ncbi:MAG: filamentous hemagglutinin N-terminal domain-containing protein, partial [Veillonellales bacterium]